MRDDSTLFAELQKNSMKSKRWSECISIRVFVTQDHKRLSVLYNMVDDFDQESRSLSHAQYLLKRSRKRINLVWSDSRQRVFCLFEVANCLAEMTNKVVIVSIGYVIFEMSNIVFELLHLESETFVVDIVTRRRTNEVRHRGLEFQLSQKPSCELRSWACSVTAMAWFVRFSVSLRMNWQRAM